MIIVFTGDGKGKTTASLGQMVRATGRGKSALMIQFIKGPWRSGEDGFAEKFNFLFREAKDPEQRRRATLFQIKKMGLGFVGILGDKLPREDHEKAAEKALDHFKEEKNKWDLIILDEVNVAVSLGLVTKETVLEAVSDFPEDKLLILSGRDAPREFIDRADLATEMTEIKHPYNYGELAKFGIEF